MKQTFALATVILTLLACAVPSALARVALQAPTTVEASQPASFSVSADGTTEVAFSVDGQTRWTTRPKGYAFHRTGEIELSAGRHVLQVRAQNAHGKVSSRRHTVVVRPPAKQAPAEPTKQAPTTGSSVSSNSAVKTGSSTEPATPAPKPTPAPAPPSIPGTTSPPEPTMPTEPTPPTGSNPISLFSSSRIGSFSWNQSAPGAVTEVADPAGSGESVYQMTVKDSDVYPITPTENPRAELVSKPIFTSGSEFWASSKFYLPAESFPSSVPGWLTLMEGPYGEPFSEVPPWHIEVSGSSIQWQRNGTYNWDVPWKMPLVRGSWVSVMLHERFASDGWIEMWINGQPITFFAPGSWNPNHVAPTTRLEMQTMDSGTNGGPSAIHLMNYRKKGMFSSVTVDEGQLKVGSTQASVES